MKSFPNTIHFTKPWRPYQARVLKDLEGHLNDDHLHIVAAPGSGKTVLGLEVMRRLNKPALILAPTLAIRDQWEARFLSMFCENQPDFFDHISKDIRNPKFLTISTYQGLFSAYKGLIDQEEIENEEEINEDEGDDPSELEEKTDLLAALKKIGIQTLVVDEAHHLRSEWWKCLIKIKEGLPSPTIVALTATPPFDVNMNEWERYKQLCGPVDSEIPVPELVEQNNLCPHQDYVAFSSPLETEYKEIHQFRNDISFYLNSLLENETFIQMLVNHPSLIHPDENIDAILSDPPFFSSIAVFLTKTQKNTPNKLLKILGIPTKQLPSLNKEFMEILLTGCFFGHAKEFPNHKILLQDLFKQLRRIRGVEGRRVVLKSTSTITKLLMSSVSKLKSISQITEWEFQDLTTNLRMVILTDYIRRSDLPKSPDDIQDIKQLGVVPIFEYLRRQAQLQSCQLGVLSGSLVIIPLSAQNKLLSLSRPLGIPESHLSLKPLPHDSTYAELEISGEHKQKTVALMTQLFNDGGIHVLIGTKSLLGEGWDAPAINTLILASFVGSYVLSNQMRGRAIRVQEGHPNKTANIWYLVCVDPTIHSGGDDLEILKRRFQAFVGVSFKENIIENRFERLNLGPPPFTPERIRLINEEMKSLSKNRDGLISRWRFILSGGRENIRIIEEIRSTRKSLPRKFVFANTISAIVWQGVAWGGYFFSRVFELQARGHSPFSSSISSFPGIVKMGFFVGALIALPYFLKALYLFIKHGSISSSMTQVGKALVRSLMDAGMIKTPLRNLTVTSHTLEKGAIACSLIGGTTFENSLFLDALEEILGPIENPRYLLVRRSALGRWARKDYHSVPEELARRKNWAQSFSKWWKHYVGANKLIYTRTTKGRVFLLKARGNSLATSFQKKSERAKIWR